MRITVEFLSLPNVAKLVGGKTLAFDLSGQTIADLVAEITESYGQPLRKFLLDETGQLDSAFRVMLNKAEWVPREGMGRSLAEGDRVTIMLLVGGG